MAGRIPPQFIDELLARVDIVDVIDARVPLKKAGREYSACCPFHNEKTPSFTVSAEKQFYHCFGCGAHGSAIGFLMEYEHLGFVEAVEELASMAGLQVPREAGKEGEHDDRNHALYDALEKVAAYYRQQLRRRPQADHAIEYLKKRGLSGEIASAFELGYAPPGWDNVVPALAGQGVSREQLLQAGMLIAKDGGGTYDRFRDRVMFPIRDRRGRVIGFGGRQLPGNDDGPKYLNSPETPIFHKGNELYGLYQARKAVRKLERLLVVEGYMDVVALAQFGVQNVVATLGTATTREHVERLFRVVPHLVFCFDGDRAGRQAAWRALENALPVLGEGRRIDFMFLPEGEDPDTLVRKEGREAFEERIAEARPFSDFFFEALCKLVDVSSIDGRARLVEQARPLLEKLPEGVFRHMMTARLAEIAKIDRAALGLSGQPAVQPQPRRDRPEGARESAPAGSPVRHMIRLLLQRPSLVAMLNEDDNFSGLDLPGILLLRELVELLRGNPQLSCGAVLEHWRGQDEGRHLAKLAKMPLAVPEEGLESELLDTQSALVKLRRGQEIKRLLDKSLDGELTDEEKRTLKQMLPGRTGGRA